MAAPERYGELGIHSKTSQPQLRTSREDRLDSPGDWPPTRIQFSNPLKRLPNISAAVSSDTNRFNMPRSALMMTSVSVTSTVPVIGVLNIAIFAESSKFSTEPCQLFNFTANCTGMPAFGRDISSKERSIVCITSALLRLCAIVIFIRLGDLTSMLRDSFSFVHTQRTAFQNNRSWMRGEADSWRWK